LPVGRGSTGYPFWSPDSRFIAFFSAGKLKKVSVAAAPPQTIGDIASGFGGAWSRDDIILLAPETTGPLSQVPASGGTPTKATELDASTSETAHRHPVFLPDGKHFLYLAVSSNPENTAIVLGALGSKERKRLVASSTKPGFVPPDHVLFMSETTLMTQRLDLQRFEMQGDPIPVAEGVAVNTSNNLAGFTASDNGVLAWRSGGTIGAQSQLVWLDRSGKTTGTIGRAGATYDNLALSPDLQRLAVAEQEENDTGDIWIFDLARGTSTRFTFDRANDNDPVWSPDGNKVVFASERGSGRLNLFQKDAGGAGTENVLLKSDHIQVPEDWSADGRFVLLRDVDPKNGADLWVLPMSGDPKPQPYLRSPFSETQARFSPNGRWVVYVSDESGRNEVYVQSFPASTRKYSVSSGGGTQPRWRGDGKELFFLTGRLAVRRTVAVADVSEAADTLRIGAQRALFETPVRTGLRARSGWEVTPDGQRFLVIAPLQDATAVNRPITVMVNWLSGVAPGR
jgi:Tol biopolymer transport system component